MKKCIPNKGETKNLIISDSLVEECNDLQNICVRWDDKSIIEGSDFEADYIYKCITEGDLPPVPDATKENYRFKSIYLKENKNLIGFTDMYYGFPSVDTVWISLFIVDKDFRKKGYAQETVNYISKECTKIGYKKIGIGVHLKNWRGLRFWTKAGFDRVSGVFGDEIYSEKTFALIGLEKIL